MSGCGEGIDGKIFRDYTIHKLLTHEVNDEYHKEGKKISHVEIEEFPDEFIEKKRYSNEFFRNCTKDDVEHAIEILKERAQKVSESLSGIESITHQTNIFCSFLCFISL